MKRLFSLFLIFNCFLLNGCGYKLMSKEDRVALIYAAMIRGYEIGAATCSGNNSLPDDSI